MIPDSSKKISQANVPSNLISIRDMFPIFKLMRNTFPLVYLDSAATTQKPQPVIDAIVHFYTNECGNIHRGVHFLSERATESYEKSRSAIRRFIHASSDNEIVFVRGATEGINLVAQTYGRTHVGPGDEVLISAMEHHSNIVPWQLLCKEKRANLRVVPMNNCGEFNFEAYEKLLGSKTRLVAVTHVSNALGTVNPVQEIIRLAHKQEIPVLVDGAQSACHQLIDVTALDCDFFVFSGHKVYGPTGIGVLYGKERLLDSMHPYQGGGDMIRSVTFEQTLFNRLPYKFEAWTQNISGAVGLGAAVDFIELIGINNIIEHEQDLLAYGTQILGTLKGLRIVGTAKEKASALSFVIEGVHPHDIATILDQHGIAIRAGHLCAQPVMEFFNIPATARASIGVYNSREDITALLHGLEKVKEVFQ